MDALGFITEQSDYAVWKSLKDSWEAERRPGYVVAGSTHYSVVVLDDVVKFRPLTNENMYNDVSLGG